MKVRVVLTLEPGDDARSLDVAEVVMALGGVTRLSKRGKQALDAILSNSFALADVNTLAFDVLKLAREAGNHHVLLKLRCFTDDVIVDLRRSVR